MLPFHPPLNQKIATVRYNNETHICMPRNYMAHNYEVLSLFFRNFEQRQKFNTYTTILLDRVKLVRCIHKRGTRYSNSPLAWLIICFRSYSWLQQEGAHYSSYSSSVYSSNFFISPKSILQEEEEEEEEEGAEPTIVGQLLRLARLSYSQ